MDRDLSSESEETEESDTSWIAWYCGLKGNEFLCEVDKSYIEDGFNLYGLRNVVPNYTESLKVILDVDPQYGCDSDILSTAALLYGLIHARYIITTQGLNAMHEKYLLEDFGKCNRHFCNCQRVVPLGLNSEPQQEVAKVYCPRCGEVYSFPTLLDGAYFGPTFPHLFFMTFSDEMPKNIDRNLKYIPKVFGFKVHSSSPAFVHLTPPQRSTNQRNAGTIQRSSLSTQRSHQTNHRTNHQSSSSNTNTSTSTSRLPSSSSSSSSSSTTATSSSLSSRAVVVLPDRQHSPQVQTEQTDRRHTNVQNNSNVVVNGVVRVSRQQTEIIDEQALAKRMRQSI